eukprot:COSAG06_NODE_112_length_23474_cov_81.804458_20_plen_86_part_00
MKNVQNEALSWLSSQAAAARRSGLGDKAMPKGTRVCVPPHGEGWYLLRGKHCWGKESLFLKSAPIFSTTYTINTSMSRSFVLEQV